MAKEVYYIKYGKANSLVKSSQNWTRFSFVDNEENETISEGRIGDFSSFESQVEAQLKTVGFQKEGFFKKNTACVAFPIDSTPSDKKNIFVCCEQIGFSEVVLVCEHVALAKALKKDFPGTKTFGIIDAGFSKVDISVVEEFSVLRKASFKIGHDRYEKCLSDPILSALLFKLIASDAKRVFEDFLSTQNFQVILTGGKANQPEFCERLQSELEFKNPVSVIEDNDKRVITELESNWNSDWKK
jgi:actin-related protein